MDGVQACPRLAGGNSSRIRDREGRGVAMRGLAGSGEVLEGLGSEQRVSRSKGVGQFHRRRPSATTAAMGDRAVNSATGCSSDCGGRRGDERGRLQAKGEARGARAVSNGEGSIGVRRNHVGARG